MKVVILAGGKGTRLGEITKIIPKPMVEIDKEPIISKIIKLYRYYHYYDFVICTGYKSEIIQQYFENNKDFLDCNIKCINTFEDTSLINRILMVKDLLDDDYFMLSYGDVISDVNLENVLMHHIKEGKLLTLTAVHPHSSYGILKLDGNNVVEFKEKGIDYNNWINGGFMVLSSKVLSLMEQNKNMKFASFLELLTKQNEINAYQHEGYWYAMDTVKDKKYIDEIINKNKKKDITKYEEL